MPDLVGFSDSDSDDMDGANWAHNGECWHAMGAVLRFILGGLLMVFPVLGVASLVMATRSMGWAVGRLQAMFGLRSKLYENATESKSESVEHTTDPQNAGSRNAA